MQNKKGMGGKLARMARAIVGDESLGKNNDCFEKREPVPSLPLHQILT
jgi:hypothetical protein